MISRKSPEATHIRARISFLQEEKARLEAMICSPTGTAEQRARASKNLKAVITRHQGETAALTALIKP
jgi:hypothetical protein